MRSEIGDLEPNDELFIAGFRFGDRGTHTSRTIMLSELSGLLAAAPINAARTEYASAIIEDNILGKQTMATRRLTNQRLGELYGLDRRLPLFRTLRRLWTIDEHGRPIMAQLCALARDPLLRSTVKAVLDLPVGAELVRASFLNGIREAVGSRLNDSILDKVARNAGSSWSQSGHLCGRVRKIRQRATPTPGAVALALWMGGREGLAGQQLLGGRWTRILDRSPESLVKFVLRAKQLGLVHARIGGGVVEIDTSRINSIALGA